MIGFKPVLSSTGFAGVLVLLLTGCARIESYVSGDPAEKEYKSATKLPPLEIPPEMNQGAISGSGALLIPGVDEDQTVTYSARDGAVGTGSNRKLEAISFLSKDENGLTTLRVAGGSATAWNEVRGALGKLGVQVKHLNRERGIYELLYPLVGEIERGVIDRLTFWNNDKVPLVNIKLVVENLGEPTTLVRAYDGDKLDNSATASALVESIHRQLSPDHVIPTAAAQPVNTARDFASQAAITPDHAGELRYRLEQHAGASRIVTTLDFPRTWREVGMAIDNEAIAVEDRDRSRGLYFVEDVADPAQSQGILKKMKFWGGDEPATTTRLVAVQPLEGGGNQILVFDKDEKLDGSVAAAALLVRLGKHLH